MRTGHQYDFFTIIMINLLHYFEGLHLISSKKLTSTDLLAVLFYNVIHAKCDVMRQTLLVCNVRIQVPVTLKK